LASGKIINTETTESELRYAVEQATKRRSAGKELHLLRLTGSQPIAERIIVRVVAAWY